MMPKVKVHIGKKIREVLDKSPMRVVEFAKSINLSRNSAYQIFEKETINTGLLQTIGHILNHDFFVYFEHSSVSAVKETTPEIGYATKSDVADLAYTILKLTKAVERLEEQLPKKKAASKKKYQKKNI